MNKRKEENLLSLIDGCNHAIIYLKLFMTQTEGNMSMQNYVTFKKRTSETSYPFKNIYASLKKGTCGLTSKKGQEEIKPYIKSICDRLEKISNDATASSIAIQ